MGDEAVTRIWRAFHDIRVAMDDLRGKPCECIVWDDVQFVFKAAAEFSAIFSGTAHTASRLTRADILDAAKAAVTVDRAATHGEVEDSFGQLAALWSALLGVPVSPAQAALMMAGLKVVRAWGNPGHADNWMDLAGYAACGGELAGREDG